MPYTAIPIYPSRMFRHSAIYIRTDRGIREPADLKGRRIGVPFYGITAVTTACGILADEYGVKPEDLIWVNGGLFDPKERLTQDLGLPASIRIEQETEKSLSQLLIEGGIDGLITAASPVARSDERAECRTALSRLPRGRAGLLQEDTHLPDHACTRHQDRGAGARPVAGAARL